MLFLQRHFLVESPTCFIQTNVIFPAGERFTRKETRRIVQENRATLGEEAKCNYTVPHFKSSWQLNQLKMHFVSSGNFFLEQEQDTRSST